MVPLWGWRADPPIFIEIEFYVTAATPCLVGQTKPACAFDSKVTTLKLLGFIPLKYVVYHPERSQNNQLGVLHLKIKISL